MRLPGAGVTCACGDSAEGVVPAFHLGWSDRVGWDRAGWAVWLESKIKGLAPSAVQILVCTSFSLAPCLTARRQTQPKLLNYNDSYGAGLSRPLCAPS